MFHHGNWLTGQSVRPGMLHEVAVALVGDRRSPITLGAVITTAGLAAVAWIPVVAAAILMFG